MNVLQNHFNKLDSYRWGTIFAIISLDLSRPFINSMGLVLPPSDDFLYGLRDLILEFRKKEFSKDSNEFSPSVHKWIYLKYGSMCSAHLISWGEEVFQYSGKDGRTIFLWYNMLVGSSPNFEKVSNETRAFLILLRHKLDSRSILPRRIDPTSAWDIELYSRHGYDEQFNPYEFIKSTVRYYHFVQTWHDTEYEIGIPIDFNSLHYWAVQEARLQGMPFELLENPLKWNKLPQSWLKK